MSVTPDRARALALSLADVTEAPHWHRIAFRTPRKTFATLDAAAGDVNLMFSQDLRDMYCEAAPQVFSPVPGGWGRMGVTRCDLRAVDEPTLLSALTAAHALAAPKARNPRRAGRRDRASARQDRPAAAKPATAVNPPKPE